MTAGTILFWLLAASTAFGAIAVVLSQNVVRMAFWLIVALGSTSGLFFLLHADFVAATQLLVYVGGTVVLLIFGVMLTASGPYNQLKMSPGNLIAVAATGAAVFFITFMGLKSVDWDRSALRQIVISPERYDAIHSSIEDEKTHEAFHVAFQPMDVQGTQVYQYAPESELGSEEQALLLELLKDNGLKFSPSTEKGGTIQPLGFGLLGARPDRDLNSPEGLRRLSDGYYVVTPPKAEAHHADDEHPEPVVSLSTGYLLPFEIASVHLLVVLIGAAYLARAKRRVDTSL